MENPNPNRMSFRASTGESGLRLMPEMFKLRLNQLAEETLDSLQATWKEAGYEDIECQRLLGDLLNKLKVTCANELMAEEKILEHAKLQVDANIAELDKLNAQLGRVADVTHIESMNYTDKLTELERMLQEIGVEVSGRQALFDKEMAGIMTLIRELGETPPNEAMYKGPAGTPELSDVRLNLMKNHRKELEQMKLKRIEEVQSLAKECYSHMSVLMYSEEGFATMEDSQAYLTLDKQIVKYAKTGDFTLSISKKEVMSLTMRFKRLIEEKERRRAELEKTGAEIAKLWSLLRVPSVEREQFQNSFKKNLSMETLNKGTDELKRLREIRRRSLGRVVSSIRNDILTLWEEAGIDSEENRRREFPLYFNDLESLDDGAVDMHEAYFTSLRTRVEELKPILIKISRRETVVQERIELEHLQMNPERLTARGPNAREERKREESMQNRVKNLDKLTKEIVSQISTWEEANGPFMYGGERYLERIPRQEEFYLEIKDSLRSARKKKDGKAEATTATVLTANSARPASTKRSTVQMSTSTPSTPYSSMKHKTLDQSVLSSASHTGIAMSAQKDSENTQPNQRSVSPSLRVNSNDSEASSVTQLKERSSQGSATVVNNH